jgi:hypothetical protein
MQNYTFSGHMVAVMANGSAIIVGVILIRLFSKMMFIALKKLSYQALFYQW